MLTKSLVAALTVLLTSTPTMYAAVYMAVYMPDARADQPDADPSPKAHTPLSWLELQSRPMPAPGERITYGPAPQEFGELRVPKGHGPFPVVIVIHGGCWLSEFDYQYITRVSASLTAAGYATWTPEFRRIGDNGGGWPNTMLDVGHAADQLRLLARKYHLDLKRVVALGHSSGGHLALWLAARHKLPKDSPLFSADPLPLSGVIGLAAITDLARYRVGPPDSCHASVDQLLGGTPDSVPQRYAQTSPLALLPLGVAQHLIQGGADSIVDPDSVRSYVSAAQKAGDHAELALIPDDGHFDLVLPEGEAWTQILAALKSLTSNAR